MRRRKPLTVRWDAAEARHDEAVGHRRLAPRAEKERAGGRIDSAGPPDQEAVEVLDPEPTERNGPLGDRAEQAALAHECPEKVLDRPQQRHAGAALSAGIDLVEEPPQATVPEVREAVEVEGAGVRLLHEAGLRVDQAVRGEHAMHLGRDT